MKFKYEFPAPAKEVFAYFVNKRMFIRGLVEKSECDRLWRYEIDGRKNKFLY